MQTGTVLILKYAVFSQYINIIVQNILNLIKRVEYFFSNKVDYKQLIFDKNNVIYAL